MKKHDVKIRVIINLLLMLLIPAGLYSQATFSFSLDEALKYARENNYAIRNLQKDIAISKKKVAETTAIGLPQIDAAVDYTNYLELPTQLIPGEFFPAPSDAPPDYVAPEFIEVQFGTKHNMTLSATLSQLLFSGSYIVGLQASRAYLDFSRLQLEKSETELDAGIAKAYYLVLVTEESKGILDSTLVTLKQMLNETRELFKAGFIQDTEVDQLELIVADMETNMLNVDRQLLLAYNYLKFQMGMKQSEIIELTDNLQDLMGEVDKEVLMNSSFDHNSHIDYQIIKNQEKLAALNLKLEQSAYLPSLSSFISLQEVAQRQEFNFLASDDNWFKTSLLGLQMNIPLFSSGSRRAKVQQARLELEKVQVLDQQLQEGLKLDLNTAKADFSNAYLVQKNKEKGLHLASRIYSRTLAKYKEGMSSSMDLLQSYNQFLSSESDYINATLNLLNTRTDLEKILKKNLEK